MGKLFPYGIVEPAKNIEKADVALIKYLAVCKTAGVRTCLAYGSCLGFVRDGGYVPGDNDIDVVAVLGWVTPAFNDALIGAGFTRGQSFPLPHNNVHYHYEKILIDIFFRGVGIPFYKKFDTVMYKNKPYPVPHPVEEYLSKCYSNWKTPMEEPGKAGL